MRKSAPRVVALGVILSPMLMVGPAAASVWAHSAITAASGTCASTVSPTIRIYKIHPEGDIVCLQDIPGGPVRVQMVVKDVTKDLDVSVTPHR